MSTKPQGGPPPEYPEHERLHAVAARSQAIGEFLDWLRADQGVHLMRWQQVDGKRPCPVFECDGGRLRSMTSGRDKGECGRCKGTGEVPDDRETWVADGRSTERLLADHFGIDLGRLEDEKRALLATLREAPDRQVDK